MKKQTTIYLSDLDQKKLEVIKTEYLMKSNGEAIRKLIENQYQTIKLMKTEY